MYFCVAHVDSACNLIHLIKLAHVVADVGVISHSFSGALEVNRIDLVKANQGHEQPNI